MAQWRGFTRIVAEMPSSIWQLDVARHDQRSQNERVEFAWVCISHIELGTRRHLEQCSLLQTKLRQASVFESKSKTVDWS